MSFRDFFHGSGKITFKNQFLSLRLIKEKLEKKFTIRILEESSSGFKCKVVRLWRLYGFPVFFPNPTLEISFKNENQESTIYYIVTCYDYYIVAISALLLLILFPKGATLIEAIKERLPLSLIWLLFYGTLVFIDTKYFETVVKYIVNFI